MTCRMEAKYENKKTNGASAEIGMDLGEIVWEP